ncbi:Nudix family hydrolase [Candidatus Methylospira mobilis]|uniref:8-oxo-dGTP diphosphatase n=1 Tax=Candidatus Methylospira mobilis TaxID=1808979 RepID=A0A5Q0BE83_9GAMM|nr:Nudix family hydrolase [Candidatus Methylospira mobilis]QFY42183.1 Nudix family hydrolase [Candidatus Methylospira mobilis]WNV03198.1 Nudix family hydrolase [Candidatus Methylospira mobilis]
MGIDLHVAVGILQQGDEVLITRRLRGSHMGGYWEFPGGKFDGSETAPEALARELREELGIGIEPAFPLIRLKYDYPDRRVILHVWRIARFISTPRSCEGQTLRWAPIADLDNYTFLPANKPILTSIRLPDRYGFVDDESRDPEILFRQLQALVGQGIRLVRLRASGLTGADYRALAERCVDYCAENGVALLLADVADTGSVLPEAAGLHLTARQLMMAGKRPLLTGAQKWVAASCHNGMELGHAERIGIDFAVLSPVLPTATHPGMSALGWERFSALVEGCSLPVFALGGMMPENLHFAKFQGAQGIAAIRGFFAQ